MFDRKRLLVPLIYGRTINVQDTLEHSQSHKYYLPETSARFFIEIQNST